MTYLPWFSRAASATCEQSSATRLRCASVRTCRPCYPARTPVSRAASATCDQSSATRLRCAPTSFSGRTGDLRPAHTKTAISQSDQLRRAPFIYLLWLGPHIVVKDSVLALFAYDVGRGITSDTRSSFVLCCSTSSSCNADSPQMLLVLPIRAPSVSSEYSTAAPRLPLLSVHRHAGDALNFPPSVHVRDERAARVPSLWIHIGCCVPNVGQGTPPIRICTHRAQTGRLD